MRRTATTVLLGALVAALGVAGAALTLGGQPTAQAAPSEGSLAARAAQEARRLSAVSGDLAAARTRLAAIDADLAARRARLADLQTRLAQARGRLVRLRLRAEVAQHELSSVLLADYESDAPDIVNVVLDAKGFADLLERLDSARRVANANANAVHVIRQAKAAVTAQTRRLAALQVVEQREVEAVAAREEAAAAIRARLASRQLLLARAHARTVGQLRALRARQAAIARRLAASRRAAQRSLAPAAAPVLTGGGFTFPMPRGSAAPPGAWSPDQGVDISAPGHTPLLAVTSGTVVGHGISGFGNSAPILRLDDGRYVYYGHAGPGGAVPVGSHVGAGQVIGEVGAGIVGISTGPHLEIGFCDAGGTPLGPQTAPVMMSLLLRAYGAG